MASDQLKDGEGISLKHESINVLQDSFSKIDQKESLRKKKHDLEIYRGFTLLLSSSIDIGESLDLVRNFLSERIHADGSSMFFISKNSNELELAFETGTAIAGYLPKNILDSGEWTREILRQEKPYYIENLSTGSVLTIPLFTKTRILLGIITIYRSTPYVFNKTEVALLQDLAFFITHHLYKLVSIENAQELAFSDGLTGIFNRRYFDQRYQREIQRAKRYTRTLSILMIDIDHFKKYNDYLGHLMGDEALRRVSRLLEGNLRKADIICRYGGEEFVVLLPEIDLEHAEHVAEKLRKAMITVDFEGEERLPSKNLTISVGVASFPQNGLTAEEVLKQADDSLYVAKGSGRNKVHLAPIPQQT